MPENALFANPHLVILSKGTKMLYKDVTMAGTWDIFELGLNFALDSRFYMRDQMLVDLGKDIACPKWGPRSVEALQSRTGLPAILAPKHY